MVPTKDLIDLLLSTCLADGGCVNQRSRCARIRRCLTALARVFVWRVRSLRQIGCRLHRDYLDGPAHAGNVVRMAHLWHTLNDDIWHAAELESSVRLTYNSIDVVDRHDLRGFDGGLLYPHRGDDGESWVLVSRRDAPAVVNGVTAWGGIRVLADRDAIRVVGGPAFYFSTERLARIEPFDREEQVYCQRCKQAIVIGDAVVWCPQCGVVHHERAEKPCFTYAATCALCDQPTDLGSTEYRWSPASL